MKDDRITLQVENPTPPLPTFFAVDIPTGLIEDDFATIIEQIEFRRKCHNQGFDNLIELLNMHKKTVLRKLESEPIKTPPV